MAEIRDDFEKMRQSIRPRASGLQSTLFVGQILNRGAMPSAAGQFVTVNPVTIGGDETEDGAATVTVDPATDVIADWLGPGAPTVGKNVMVESVANRWVAWTSGTTSTCVPCLPCCIPKRNLTVSWTNGMVGGGATGMAWDGDKTWNAPVVGGDIGFRFGCVAGRTVFSVLLGGTWTSDDCLHLVLTRCSPFQLVYSASACTFLARVGYLQFIITQ